MARRSDCSTYDPTRWQDRLAERTPEVNGTHRRGSVENAAEAATLVAAGAGAGSGTKSKQTDGQIYCSGLGET